MRQDIEPHIWGPAGWEFLDAVVNGYPDNPSQIERDQMILFLQSLVHLLPCASCRANYRQYILKNPVRNHVASKQNVYHWLRRYKESSKPMGIQLENILHMAYS